MKNKILISSLLLLSQISMANGGNWFGGPSGAEMDRHLDVGYSKEKYYNNNPDQRPVYDRTRDGQHVQRLDSKTGKPITQGDVQRRQAERAQQVENHAARNPRTAQQIEADTKKIGKMQTRYETALNSYRNLRKDPSVAQYSQASWGPEIRRVNVDNLIKKHGYGYTFSTLSAELTEIENQSASMKQTIKFHADMGTTRSQLHTRPRAAGTKVLKKLAPLGVVAAFGYSGANAAEASPLAGKNSSNVNMSDDTIFRADPASSVEKFGTSLFVESDGQK